MATKKCAMLIEERTSIPYCVLTAKEPLSKKEITEKAIMWVNGYITDNHCIANPFRIVVKSEKSVPKKYVLHQHIERTDDPDV